MNKNSKITKIKKFRSNINKQRIKDMNINAVTRIINYRVDQ